MRALASRVVALAALALPVLLFAVLLLLPLAPLFAQADSGGVVEPGTTTVAVVFAPLAAFVAQLIGTAIVNILNKVGGILEGASAGSKRILAVTLTGLAGLALNALAALVTHSTSWLLTLGLSIVAGIISIIQTGMAIDTANAKAALKARGIR